MYQLEFLPTARQDMIEIVQYISMELKNPIAANHLAEEFFRATNNIQTFPYTNSLHMPIRALKREYRKSLVQNYLIFYWVEEEKKLVTIARVLYAGKDYK